MGVVLRAHTFVVNRTFNANGEVATVASFVKAIGIHFSRKARKSQCIGFTSRVMCMGMTNQFANHSVTFQIGRPVEAYMQIR